MIVLKPRHDPLRVKYKILPKHFINYRILHEPQFNILRVFGLIDVEGSKSGF